MTKVKNIFVYEDEIKHRVPKKWLVNKPVEKINAHEKLNKSRNENFFDKVTDKEVSIKSQNPLKITSKKKNLTRQQRQRQQLLYKSKKKSRYRMLNHPLKCIRKCQRKKK